MPDESPNLFNALFRYHPRDGHTPWENFLTEAVAYILMTEQRAAEVWLSLMLDRPIEVVEVDVFTQNSERIEDTAATVFPDLKVTASLKDNGHYTVYCEHKWDSRCNPDQLRGYAKLAKRDQGKSIVTFVGANRIQVRAAEKLKCVQKAVYWEEIYSRFEKISDQSQISNQLLFKEFLIFMATQGLSPGAPLNINGLRALKEAPAVKKQLMRYTEKLHHEFDWTFLDPRYHQGFTPPFPRAPTFPQIRDRWGRVGIEFVTEGWAPEITVGFLYDTHDHRVNFVRPEDGIDLMLRIGACPKANPDNSANTRQVLDALGRGRERILNQDQSARVLLRGEQGNTKNKWNLLIVQKCLADVIEDCGPDESKQLEAIYNCLRKWLNALFSDTSFEVALRKLAHYTGTTY